VKGSDKIIIECEICNNKYSILYENYKRSEKLGRRHICKKCNGKLRVPALRKGHEEYFSKEENHIKHSRLCREIWNDRPQEFKNKQLNMLMTIGQEYRDSVDFPAISSERLINHFKNPENRKKLSNIMKDIWKRRSKFEKELAMVHLVDYWDNITPKELDEWYKKSLDGSILNDSIISGPSEEKFQSDLDSSGKFIFRYKRQYRNQIKHPDFNTKFPINPVTGSKRVSPYHIWDFIIYGNEENILVDIDGKIHNLGSGTVTYCGKPVEFSEVVKFNDSKRPYQTDGMDAYVVNAYNDKIEDDTTVIRVSDKSSLTYKELMTYLEKCVMKNDQKF